MKIWILTLILSFCYTLPTHAERLMVYSIHRPEQWWVAKDQHWQTLGPPTPQIGHVQLSSTQQLIYQDANYHWQRMDTQTGKSTLIAKENVFASGFLHVLPTPRSDGSYYAQRILPYGLEVHRIAGQKAIPFLKKPGLYDFLPLPDGSYVYVIWSGKGNESPDFIDYIPGQPMQLWHKPLSGKARLLGKFETVHDLQVTAGQQLLFFTPGKKQAPYSWHLMAYDLSKSKVRHLSDIPKSDSRGTPQMVSWPQSDWVVYPQVMPTHANDHMPQVFMRHHVRQGTRHSLGKTSAFLLKGKGAPGYITSIVYGTEENAEEHSLVTYALASGNIVHRQNYRWRAFAPERAIYWPSTGLNSP